MKGSLNLQIDYDTTRTPSGDRRYDFVTKVNGDPILDQLSLAERQAFDMGIADHVNEMLAGTHRISVPKEKWLFKDVALLLCWFNRSLSSYYLQYSNWREVISEKIELDAVWKNVEAAVSESMGDEFANLLKFPDPKIKYIGDTFLRNILKVQFSKDCRLNCYQFDGVDDLIVFLRKQIGITPETLYHGYNIHIVSGLLKETYSFTEDELIFLFDRDGKRSLARYFEEPGYVEENQIKFIAKRAEIDPDVFLSQVIATAKVSGSNDNETS